MSDELNPDLFDEDFEDDFEDGFDDFDFDEDDLDDLENGLTDPIEQAHKAPNTNISPDSIKSRGFCVLTYSAMNLPELSVSSK